MKRFFSVMLILLMLSALTAGAYAETVYTEGTLYYVIRDGEVIITGCFGRDAELRVPAMIAGNPVCAIAEGAFAGNRFIETVYLPDTVTDIAPGAFGEEVQLVYENESVEPEVYATPEPSASPVPSAAPSSEASSAQEGISETDESGSAVTEENIAEDTETQDALPQAEGFEDGAKDLDEPQTALASKEAPQSSEKKHAGGIDVLCVASVAVVAAVIVLKKRSVKKQ